ncbi:MAG: energy transducer TonB [Pseudomonadota bacterium]|nr:energy transducer TonB [Pseudomonadota bacterium]
MMLWLMLASQLAAPIPTNDGSWLTAGDVPDYLVEAGPGLWVVAVRLDVTAEGKISVCTIEATSRVRELDRQTCEILRRRARFLPARWSDGSVTSGVHRVPISWLIADAPRNAAEVHFPLMELTVNSLPPGLRSPTYVRVNFAVDADGKTRSCKAEEWQPQRKVAAASKNPALVSVACEHLTRSYRAVVGRDGGGSATRSVQNGEVSFSIQK